MLKTGQRERERRSVYVRERGEGEKYTEITMKKGWDNREEESYK